MPGDDAPIEPTSKSPKYTSSIALGLRRKRARADERGSLFLIALPVKQKAAQAWNQAPGNHHELEAERLRVAQDRVEPSVATMFEPRDNALADTHSISDGILREVFRAPSACKVAYYIAHAISCE
jgi:hypothetical protein